jgi:hypothetical protein
MTVHGAWPKWCERRTRLYDTGAESTSVTNPTSIIAKADPAERERRAQARLSFFGRSKNEECLPISRYFSASRRFSIYRLVDKSQLLYLVEQGQIPMILID